MAGAWVLVALIEWAASRADRRRDAIPMLRRRRAARAAARRSRPGSCPPVEHTLLEPAPDSPTAVTKLPPADLDDDRGDGRRSA